MVHVHERAGAAPARSTYAQERVSLIAPPTLLDRDAELARLEEFCQAATGHAYAWWRGPPWAGKSALMAWFIRHPPAGVAAVSFFVTSRWGHHDKAEAFADVLIEQLAELLGEAVPDYLSNATRDQCFLDLLRRAAQCCTARDTRLVLVVDGLDEDCGRVQSIVSLLPVQPPHGLRIVVTSRSGMRLPADVAGDHPLADAGTHHELPASPRAVEAREQMRLELRRLLLRGGVGQDLLGLLVAAGGGLGERELAELTGTLEWEIEEHVADGVGRLLLPGSSRWGPHESQQVYVLGHKDLKYEAEQHLGDARLAGYRQQIHAWAASYRKRRWPAETPEYLFHGYFRLLQHSGDAASMITLALDGDRHDRMLDLTGGDVAGTIEVADVQDQLLLQDNPNLGALVRLAVHHEALVNRNGVVPAALPAAWAALGRSARAEALARSAVGTDCRAQALEAAAVAAASVGDVAAAESMVSTGCRDSTLGEVIRLVARFDPRRAQALVASITNDHQRARALGLIVREIAGTDPHRATTIARALKDPYAGARALTVVARVLISTGEVRQAKGLITRASLKIDSVPDPIRAARALAALTWAQLAAGETREADFTADRLESALRRIYSPSQRARVSASAAAAMKAVGRPDRYAALTDEAERIAYAARDDRRGVPLLLVLAKAVAPIEPDRARILLMDAVTTARNGDPAHRVTLLLLVTEATGDPNHRADLLAEAVAAARDTADDADRATRLSEVARVVAAAEPERARALVQEAEALIRGLNRPRLQPVVWLLVVRAAVAAGAADLAESVARGALDGALLASALATIAKALAEQDQRQAERLVAEATGLTGRIRNNVRRTRLLLDLAETKMASGDVAGAGDLVERAERTARRVDHPTRARGLAKTIARTSAAIGRAEPARSSVAPSLFREPRLSEFIRAVAAVAAEVDGRLAEMLAHTAGKPYMRARALVAVAEVVPHTDHARTLVRQAEIVAAQVTARLEQSELCSAAARALRAADPDWARALLDRAVTVGRSISSADRRGQALESAARAASALGDHDQAREIAQSIEHPAHRERAMTLAERLSYETWLSPAPPLKTIARDLAEIGDYARAEVVGRFILEPAARDASLAQLAGIMATQAAFGRIPEVASSIADPDLRARIDMAVACAQAETGDPDTAERAVLSIFDPRLRLRALHRVITAMARSALYDRAQQLTRFLAEEDADKAYAAIARAAAARGDLDWVPALARHITDPAREAAVLIETAATAAAPYARRLLARAIRVDGWHHALVPLAHVDPEAALEAIDEVRRAFAEH